MSSNSLSQIFPQLSGLDIRGVTADSRRVEKNWLFVAVPGVKADGAGFIADAIHRGASAVITQSSVATPAGAVIIQVPDARLALAQAAAAFYPAQPEKIVAVTGTSGKTSVADFTRQFFQFSGQTAASIGTLGVIRSDGASYGSLTTPDPVTLHATLDRLAHDGVRHVAMEASSHGLDQKRLHGVRLCAAAFTNLGHDHLDYHKTVADYLAAKMKLFTELLPQGAPAIINADCAHADAVRDVVNAAGRRPVMVGLQGDDIMVTRRVRDGFVQRLEIAHAGHVHRMALNLLGDFQAENAVVAAALAIAVGVDAGEIFAHFGKLTGVPGRLEVVGQARGGIVLVDYAHKPEALEAALSALRPFSSGRLRVVFGCGGDRDRAKRPLMGAIAQRLADDVIVTDDNPRSEVPAAIRAEILVGASRAREIGDRRAAIFAAVNAIGAGDVVLIAGKGHETGQIIGNHTEPFSDTEVARAALQEIAA